MLDSVPVESKCKKCGQIDRFEVPRTGLEARNRGVGLVQAFPGLDQARIVQLATHVCPKCQGVADV